jgi:hypothetical protein
MMGSAYCAGMDCACETRQRYEQQLMGIVSLHPSYALRTADYAFG